MLPRAQAPTRVIRSFDLVRVGIIQSCYIPWRGYFDFIAESDVFVVYDDVQYSTGSWRNRNKVKSGSGTRWLTVPVQSGANRLDIDRVRVGHARRPWQAEHRRLLAESLGAAPYFAAASALWEEAIGHGDEYLSDLNTRLIRAICGFLGINTRLVKSRDYNLSGTRTARLIELLTKLGATTYVSGPSAGAYIDENLFRESGIGLEYKSYSYREYPQLAGDFIGEVTVLDLIANCGPDSHAYLKSITSNRIAVAPG